MMTLPKLIPPLTYILLIFFLVPSLVISQAGPPVGFIGAERDALYALKADLNNNFLSKNWTGLQCYMNSPPRWYGIQCLDGRVTGISLEGMRITGKVNVNALVNLTELSSLSFKNNMISGNVMDFTLNKKLRHIDLSDNMFDGTISSTLLSLDFLESLLLQGNNLTGPIPGFNQLSLAEFNVSNNNLSGEIPQTSVLQSFYLSSYIGNPDLCGSPTQNTCDGGTSEAATAGQKKKLLTGASLIAIFVVLDVIGLAIVVFLFCVYYKKVKKNKKDMKTDESEEVENKKENEKNIGSEEVKTKDDGRKLTFLNVEADFELNDLLKSSAEGLGKGNFGTVYKAKLDNGRAFVVKRLRDLRPLSEDEFAKQMRVLADMNHPNLLPPLAYYYSKDEKLMVYKFAHNGNLFDRLHGGKGNDRLPFKWNSRLLVAQGVARAMEFLHLNTKSQTTILHGNLKLSNILLDENEMPLVSDYGFASLIAIPIAAQRMTSYKCPEYQARKKISKKADVWSYGCLLLELLTGRISTYSAPQGINGVDLCSWAHSAVREEWTAEIFDIEISMQRNAVEGMLKVLQIALQCCDKSAEKRPDMEEIVRELEHIKPCDSEDDSDFSFEPSGTEDSI